MARRAADSPSVPRPKLDIALREEPTGTVGESGTDVYPSLTPTFAMKFGHAERASGLGANDPDRLARDFGVARSLVRTTIEAVVTTLRRTQEDVLDATEREVGVESPVLHRLSGLIQSRAARLEATLVRG